MDQTQLLKRIPKEHWTTHKGKLIKVEKLLSILNEKNINHGSSGRGENNSLHTTRKTSKRGSLQRRRNKKKNK